MSTFYKYKFTGEKEINDFKKFKLEVKLPILPDKCKYIDNIQYFIIKKMRYKLKYIPNDSLLVDSDSFGDGLSGDTLYMYTILSNRKHINKFENNIVTLEPYNMYYDTLSEFIDKEHNLKNLKDFELEFEIELNKLIN